MVRRLIITLTWLSWETSYAFTNANKWMGRACYRTDNEVISSLAHDNRNVAIERQSDEKYGRGINHISADINEGDIIAYQIGTWYVDGNQVGDGSDPEIRFMLVDTIQIVWTHNCEHGVINGFDATMTIRIDEDAVEGLQEGAILVIKNCYVQCGPEQVVAKIPARTGTEKNEYVSLVQFQPSDEIIVG